MTREETNKMSRKIRKARENPLKKQDWHKWKSRQLRSSHLARLRKTANGDYKSRMREVPTAKDFEIWLRTNEPYTCFYCDEDVKLSSLEIDHQTPVSRGGSFDFNNLAITNKLHNRAKGDLTRREYLQLLELLNKWEDKAKWSVINRLIQSTGIYKRGKK